MQSEHSFAGCFGQLLEPVIRALGYLWTMDLGWPIFKTLCMNGLAYGVY